MNKYILGLKREYWEYRRTVFVVPIVFSVLVILASAAATFATHHGERDFNEVFQSHDEAESTTDTEKPDSDDDGAEEVAKALTPEQQAQRQSELKLRTSSEFAGFYLALAWLTSIVYLLSSMYGDRKDKSILYWKSLPVSETQNALTKLVFGGVGMPLIALLVAWAVYLLLMALGLGAVKSLDDGESWEFVERGLTVSRLFIWPVVGVVIGALWGAPLFCYTLMVSAIAKRLPFFLLVLPWAILASLESIFTDGHRLSGFFFDHLPFAVISRLPDVSSLAELFHEFFIERGGSMFAGLALSAGFVAIAVWYRNNRFEL